MKRVVIIKPKKDEYDSAIEFNYFDQDDEESEPCDRFKEYRDSEPTESVA